MIQLVLFLFTLVSVKSQKACFKIPDKANFGNDSCGSYWAAGYGLEFSTGYGGIGSSVKMGSQSRFYVHKDNADNLAGLEFGVESFSFAIKIKTTDTNWASLIYRGLYCSSSLTNEGGYELRLTQLEWGEDPLVADFQITNTGGKCVVVKGKTAVNDGKWHSIVGTCERKTEEAVLKIYVDGILDGETVESFDSEFVITNTRNIEEDYSTIFFGGNNDGTNFNGELDDIEFYEELLKPEDIFNQYGDKTGIILSIVIPTSVSVLVIVIILCFIVFIIGIVMLIYGCALIKIKTYDGNEKINKRSIELNSNNEKTSNHDLDPDDYMSLFKALKDSLCEVSLKKIAYYDDNTPKITRIVRGCVACGNVAIIIQCPLILGGLFVICTLFGVDITLIVLVSLGSLPIYAIFGVIPSFGGCIGFVFFGAAMFVTIYYFKKGYRGEII